VLVAQGVLLLVATTGVYRSGQLSADFAHFHQAWYLMAHGHLNPTSTFYPSTFLNQHGELIMWLIAPLYWLNRDQGLTLLVLQALAIVASIAVAASWLLAVARRHRLSAPVTGICVGVLLALCAFNPWIYAVVYEDFHIEVLAALFALAAGRDLYLGHGRRAVVWILLGLLSGDVAASYVVAVGVGLVVAAKGVRRNGAIMAIAGLLWFGALIGVGATSGSPAAGYRYLSGTTKSSSGLGGVAAIVEGMVSHPRRPLHRLHTEIGAVWDNLIPSGVAGLFDPLMVLPVLAVLLANGLNSADFITVRFQNLALFLFASLGTALICVRLAGARAWRTIAVGIVAAATVASALVFDLPRLRAGAEVTFRITPVASRQLAEVRALVPDSAEVVSSFGVVGRFSGRTWAYAILTANFPVPVRAREVIFVLAPAAGNIAVPGPVTAAAANYVTSTLQATEIYHGSDVEAYVWHPLTVGGVVVLP